MTEGILLLNKPTNHSSYDCIRALKKILPPKTKIGHAGTLDPFADGLMIIAIGRTATRHLSAFMGLHKTYHATAKIGILTDTLDHTGADITPTQLSPKVPSLQALTSALEQLQPAYEQIPPTYAALKHNGQPLYKLVRTQKITDAEAEQIALTKRRIIQIFSAHITNYAPPHFTIAATVSKGTYIRSLMNDVAQKAGSLATTSALCRTAIGPFKLANALRLEDLAPETLTEYLLPIEEVLMRSTMAHEAGSSIDEV